MPYLRFIFCLAVGLTGVAVVLKTLMDTLFIDWDISADIKKFIDDFYKKKQRFIYAEMEPQKVEHLTTRLIPEYGEKFMERQFLAAPEASEAAIPWGIPRSTAPEREFGRPAEPFPQLLSLSQPLRTP